MRSAAIKYQQLQLKVKTSPHPKLPLLPETALPTANTKKGGDRG